MAENLTTATINVRGNTRGLEKDILKSLRDIEFSQINTKKSSQALGRITGQVSEFNKSLEASNARVIAFGASAGAIFAVERAFASLISSTIEVEKKLTDINVLLNVSSSQLEKFGDSLFGIARNTAQSFSVVADAAAELARQGLGIEETLKRTNAALILTRLSGLDAKSSVEALTATLNSFSGAALDAAEVVNKLANVDAAFAVSSADLANGIARVGSTAQDAGVSLDELLALVTTAQQITSRGGAVIGNSFKTIFTRLQRGSVKDALAELGIDTSETQNAVGLLKQLADVYDTLGATQKASVAESVGGVFQINILKAALSDLGREYSIYNRALDISLSSTDEAIRRNELLNQTVSALSTQAFANLEQAANKIGSLVFTPNAKGFLSGFNDILSAFNNIDSESAGGKLMEGFFKGIGNFISGPGAVLATAVLVKLFAKLSQFAAGSARELLGTNKAAQQQAAIEQSILSILQKNSQFTSQILSGKMTTVQAEKELLNYLTAQSNILREQERLSKIIGSNLRMVGVSIGASGIPMVGGATGKKAAASGFVPSFASDMAIGQAMENAGARQHGYKAGKARKTRIHDGNGKSFTSFVNSKEDVKTFTNAAGKKATIVRPPNGFGENTQFAAGGFVPNFAKNKVESLSKVKSGGNLKKLYDFGIRGKSNSKTDYYSKNVSVDRIKLPYSTSTYDARAEVLINRSLEQKKDLSSLKYKGVPIGNYLSSSFDQSKLATGNKIGNISNIKGALGEIDTEIMLKKMGITPVKLSNEFGVDFSYKDKLLKEQLGESKVNKKPVKDDVIYAKALTYVGRKASPSYKGNDNSDTIDLSALGVGLNLFESKASGFVPNFAKASDLYKRIKAAEGVTDPFNKEKNKKGVKKDLGSLPYTMIHGGDRGFKKDQFASFSDKEKNIDYQAKMNVAGLNSSKIKNRGIETRVGEALVTETNDLVKIFNPGAKEFSSPKQLANAGSVGSAAGTVFESAIRSAFQNEASGPESQTSRIDFPAPSEALRGFFYNSPGPYEAKINDSLPNRSSALSKWVAVNNLAGGFLPKGFVFSKSKKDEFGFETISAKKDGKKVGSIEYFEDLPGVVETGSFSVDKQFRGMGIGRSLYQEMLKRNAGKKITGQLLPQTGRFLEKLKRGERVSAETLYPQMFRAGSGKDSVFEVYGHKGMDVEKMSRQQFTNFVNAKIKELQGDPKKFRQFFGDVDGDPGSGLGVKLDTQHSAGFVPNFARGPKGPADKLYKGYIFPDGEIFNGFDHADAWDDIPPNLDAKRAIKYISTMGGRQVVLQGKLNKSISDTFSRFGVKPTSIRYGSIDEEMLAVNQNVIDDKLSSISNGFVDVGGGYKARFRKYKGAEPMYTHFVSPDGSYYQITGGIPPNDIKYYGGFENLASDRLVKKLDKQRVLELADKFNGDEALFAGGYVPNFADDIRRNIYDWDGTIIPKITGNAEEYISKLSSLKEKDLLPLGKKLKSGNKKFDIFTARPPIFDNAITNAANRLGLPFNKINFGIKPKDKLVEARNRKSKLIDDDLGLLGEDRFLNARRLNKRLYSGFVPNFAASPISPKAYYSRAGQSWLKGVEMKPSFDPVSGISFPDFNKKKNRIKKIVHVEGVEGSNVYSPFQFEDLIGQHRYNPSFWKRRSFEYVSNSAGFVPNFADALKAAIEREKSAGLSSRQIYVDKHSSLKNKNNPMGLMVANTRDEPRGGTQGIKRAKKEGRNPKTYGGGASSGYVPNFALNDPGVFSSLVRQAAGAGGSTAGEIENAQAAVRKAIKKFPELGSEFEKVSKKFEGLNSDIDAWIKKTKELGGSASKSKSPTGGAGNKSERLLLNDSRQIVFSRAGQTSDKETKDQQRRAEAEAKARAAAQGEGSYQTFAMGGPPASAPYDRQRRRAELIQARKNAPGREGLAGGPSRFSKSILGKGFESVKQNPLGVGFGLQALSGSVGQLMGGGDETTGSGKLVKGISDAVGTVSSFAATGAMFGPKGALIGAGVGLVKATYDAVKTMNSKVPELEKALQLSSDSLNRFGESGQKILQLNEQYSEALKSGNPSQAADIMVKTQQAYAEELSKLTESQRGTLISAIAQGKGQEGYAKILSELQDSAKAQEAALTFQKFQESGGPFGGPDKRIVEGIDKSLVQDLTRGLDAESIQKALDNAANVLQDPTAGTENQAIALMRSLAGSESLSADQKANFEKIIDSFANAAADTDLSKVAEGFLKGVAGKPKSFEDLQKAQDAAKAAAAAEAEKRRKEIEIREKANASLLKLQSDTENIYQRFNNSVEDFISSMETMAEMRAAAGEFRAGFYSEGGVPSAAESQKEKNILSASRDRLNVDVKKSQFEASNNFRNGVETLLEGVTANAAKLRLGETASSQENELLGIRSSLEQALLPVQQMLLGGQYEAARGETQRVLGGLSEEQKSAIGSDKLVDIGIQLDRSVQESARKQDLIYKNSQKDLAIQAQQLVFQKAMSKLAQAQAFGGGSARDILTDSSDTSFNQATQAVEDLKTLGYNQRDLRQGKVSAVRGGDAESYGIRGEKANTAMLQGLIDFYGAASKISGEPVLSTQSKDFGVLAQALSEKIRKEMDELRAAGEGVVDPMVFARLESTLNTLGGEDKVAQLKIFKDLGVADVGGKQILDEALKSYTGGAFAGLSPDLKKAFESTTDEGAGATLLLIAGQEKQTDSLSQGLAAVTAAGIEGNNLLAAQPDAIAAAIGAVLETGRAEQNYQAELSKSKELEKQYSDMSTQLRGLDAEAKTKKSELESARGQLSALGVSESDYTNKDELEKAKSLVGNYSRTEGLTETDKFRNLFAGMAEQFISFDMEAAEKYYTMADSDPKTLQAEYDKALALIQASELASTVSQKESELKEVQTKSAALSKAGEEIIVKQDEQSKKTVAAGEARRSAASKAAVTKNLTTTGAGSDYIANVQSTMAARAQALATTLGVDDLSKTKKQKEAIARSTGAQLTWNQSGGRQDTFENVAITKAGGANVEAFTNLIEQNVLPSLKQFSKVYESMGVEGGAKAAFEKQKAEMFGIQKVGPRLEPPSLVKPLALPPEQQRQIAPPEQQERNQEQIQKQTEIRQEESQALGSILGAVNQIAQIITNPQQGVVGAQANGSQSGTVSTQSVGAGAVNVSTPVSLTVNANAQAGGNAEAAAIAEQIKAGISSFLSSPEFISKVTSIANQAAGNKVPPKIV